MNCQVFQGKKTVTLELPDKWKVHEVPMPGDIPMRNPEERLKALLKDPFESPPLAELIKPGDQIAICVTDISRPSPDYILLPPILQELERIGVNRNSVTIIIGTGSHRAVSLDEMKAKYGYYATTNYRIVNHDSRDQFSLTDLGKAATGAPRVVNTFLTMVNHIISIGVMDLHQYAGYSGGAKTIAVGCAGEDTIQHTHSADFLEKSGAVPGRVEGNLFQKTLWEIVEPLNFDFSVNLILNEKGEIIEMNAGNPRPLYYNMVDRARELFEYECSEKFDVVYLGVPFPKDINLYQATRAATYQAMAEPKAIKKGGIINLLCSCPEGVGKGVGETRFRERLLKLPNPAAILLSMTGQRTLPGEQRAFMAAKAMLDHKINVVGTSIKAEDLRKLGFTYQKLVPEEYDKIELNAAVLKDGMKKLLKYKE